MYYIVTMTSNNSQEIQEVPRVTTQAFVSLCCNNAYAVGALVWARSLRAVSCSRDIVLLVTQQVSPWWLKLLREAVDCVEVVDLLDSEDKERLRLLQRADLGITFTKLHCWRLTQYKKAVFMDADTLVLRNIDDLFEREELTASPDPGWPDCFNSGVFVFKPSLDTFEKLMRMAVSQGSFDGGDQGLLNQFFRNWHRLPFTDNCAFNACYTYQPALEHFREDVRVVHFIGSQKPWHWYEAWLPAPAKDPRSSSEADTASGVDDSGTADFLRMWWRIYSNFVSPNLLKDDTDHRINVSLHFMNKQLANSAAVLKNKRPAEKQQVTLARAGKQETSDGPGSSGADPIFPDSSDGVVARLKAAIARNGGGTSRFESMLRHAMGDLLL